MIKPGDVCFAKVRGYIPWPARVNVLPKDVKIPRGKVPVFFYGTHEVSYVTENDIFDYAKNKEIYGTHKERNGRFNQGMKELESNPTILQLGFDKGAIKYLSQFYRFDQKKSAILYYQATEETIIEMGLTCGPSSEEPKAPVTSRKRPLSKSSDFDNKKSKVAKLSISLTSNEPLDTSKTDVLLPTNENVCNTEEIVPIKEPQTDFNCCLLIERLPETEAPVEESEKSIPDPVIQDSDSEKTLSKCSEVESFPSETLQSEQLESYSDKVSSFKSPIRNTDIERPKRASAIKFNENLQLYKRHHHTDDNGKTKTINRIKEDKPHAHSNFHHSKRNKERGSFQNRNHSSCQHPANIVISDEERNLRIVSELSVIDKEIKRSLIVGHENYDMCRKLMDKLTAIETMNLVFLCKVPEIVTTMRKCRRYKKDDSIKSRASEIYQRFNQIYENSDIDEKIEAGTELLKRDSNSCKSAQTLMDEIFVSDSKNPSYRSSLACVSLSSPGSAPSHQSSADNTPLLPSDTDSFCQLDPVVVDINVLLHNGSLQLIECYDAEKGFSYPLMDDNDVSRPGFSADRELYKQLGV